MDFRLFGIALLLALSCSQANRNDPTSPKGLPVERAKLKHSDGLDICELSEQHKDIITKTAISDPVSIIESVKSNPANEECVFKLLEILSDPQDLRTENLKALEAINRHSDGFLSEYFMEITMTLLNNSSEVFLDYLMEAENSILLESLTHGLSMELSMQSMDKEKYMGTILSKVTSDRHRSFIRQIFQKVDRSKFE